MLHITKNYALQTLCGEPHKVANDDGKLMNLPMCRSIHEIGDIIFGSFFVCAAPPGHRNFTSLSKEQIERYKERFRFPETFLRIGGDAIFVLRNL